MYEDCGDYDDDDVGDVDEDRSVVDMLTQLQRYIHTAESRLSTWKDLRTAAEADAAEARKVR